MPPYRKLKISDNRRFLLYDDGAPFFYLADTAWELFHRCDRGEADLYLRDRAAKGFTAVQAVALAELDGLRAPNPYGHLPLEDEDPARPNGAYFEHVDYIVDRAHELGLYVALLPTWGDKFNRKWGKGPEVFTPENARAFGRFLGARYGGKNIIWVLGGDRDLETDLHAAIVRATAEGIKEGDGGFGLMTFHPQGGKSSSTYVHAEPWLDFHMIQSGHHRFCRTYEMVERDYRFRPARPTMDAEPGYEDHPNHFNPRRGWLDEHDVRRSLYWSLFAGGCGYTYGCHDIWQMWQGGREPVSWARTPWKEALAFPGSAQVGHARALLEERPYQTRVPDQSVVAGDCGRDGQHIRAARCSEGNYILVYLPEGQWVEVDMRALRGDRARARFFNPRSGEYRQVGEVECGPRVLLEPPYDPAGRDWVLALDSAQ